MDKLLLELINGSLANPILDVFMIGLTMLAPAFLPILAVPLLLRGKRRQAIALLITLAVALVLTFVFYLAGMRPRPSAVMPALPNLRIVLPPPLLPSFPSGHTMLAFAAAVLLGLQSGRRRGLLLAIMVASSIGISRIYLGHHFPSDVVAGAVMGATLGAAGYGCLCLDELWTERIRWLLWPQIGFLILVTMMAYIGILPWRLLSWPNSDKIMHFLLFGAVAFWLNLWLEGRTLPPGKYWPIAVPLPPLPIAIILPLAIAGIEEGLQLLSPLRSGSPLDLGADLLGLILFWWLSQQLLQRAQKQQRNGAAPQRRAA